MRRSFLFFLLFILVGCGYKPVNKVTKSIFDEPVLVKVAIDPEDPKVGEYLEDEITKMAIKRLNLKVTKDVDEAQNYILVNRYVVNTSPINKDDEGNVIRYSVNAAVEFAIKDKKGFWSKNIVTNEYVPVKPKSQLNDEAKEKATKLAIKKALDEFVLAVYKRGQDQ